MNKVDAVELKNAIQRAMIEEDADKTDEKAQADFERYVRESGDPLAKKWRRIRNRTASAVKDGPAEQKP